MNRLLKRISQISFCLFIVALPFKLDVLISTPILYEGGFFNHYLSYFIYLSDLFLIMTLLGFGILVCCGREKLRIVNKVVFCSIAIFIAFVAASILFAVDRENSLLYFLRFVEFFFVYYLIQAEFIPLKKLLNVFLYVMLFASFLGLLQFAFQGSIGLPFLGEPFLSGSDLGTAKVEFWHWTFLRPYAAFSHPNVFAAYLLFAIIFSYHLRKNVFILLFTGMLLLTFSRGALLAFLILFLYSLIKNPRSLSLALKIVFAALIAFLMLRLFDSSGYVDRLLFMDISKNIFLNQPFGVGIGNFTSVMGEFSRLELMPWQFQPVHNAYFLILNELGIQALLLFVLCSIFLGFNLLKRSSYLSLSLLFPLCIAVVTLGLFDHYFLTIYQGQALLFIFFGLLGVED